ncbi:MAG: histidine--tRNA ligase [Acidimicrobiaceae bacterium]|nr:histidine--tRNA ligase [Acidimicrobiaceae bacterium]MYB85775.1 histidine--tRNA ligase [Acidimicrobiaceae bacterium]MYH94254.1 histidine--tRNA ligase [Acidimicrobiaceae bacterium]
MAQPLFRAPAGTRDLLPPESARRRRLVAVFADLAERTGFGLLESPIFEDLGVFQRLGESNDVVTKELFEFFDKGDPPRHLALRPELTASVCRAFAEHRPTPPWKIWYSGPQFRYERPQAGRYRQFDQVGVETLGTDDPHADVEVIGLGARFYEALGMKQVRLLVNSLGDSESRPAYDAALAGYLQSRRGELSAQSRVTLERNPLRVLDSKREQDQPVIAEAPLMADFLSGESADHFAAVLAGLDSLGAAYEVSPRLVRGLDYYTRTTFEFVADALDTAQNAVGGGGRYDGLVEELGGPPTPGIGFALGVDRILLACDAEGALVETASPVEVFVVDTAGGESAVVLCDRLRRAGLGVDRAFDARSMKAQMKRADRSGAAVAVIVGPDEGAAGTATVRDMRPGGGQRQVPSDDVVSAVTGLLAGEAP